MTEPRLFTLEEAERTLPLVRRVVGDLMAEHRAWRRAVGRFELAAAGLRADEAEPDAVREARQTVEAHAERIGAFQAELERVGCLLKGFDAGLVDFYSLRGDRLVFLCWQFDEPRITHWHEVDAGVAGRRPVDDGFLTAIEAG